MNMFPQANLQLQSTKNQYCIYRRWAGKTSYVHLAPSLNMNTEQNISRKLIRISLKHVPWPQIHKWVSVN